MSKTRNNQVILLKMLLQGKALSKQGILDTLGEKSPQSAYNYIKSLQKQGYDIEKTKEGRTCYYSIRKTDEMTLPKSTITSKIYHKCLLMTELETLAPPESNGISRKELFQHFQSEQSSSSVPPLYIAQAQFYRLMKEMEQEGLIEAVYHSSQSENASTIRRTRKYLLPSLYTKTEDKLSDLCIQLESITQDHLYYPQAQSILNKIQLAGGNYYPPQEDSESFLRFGRPMVSFQGLHKLTEQLYKKHFDKKVVKITYQTKHQGTKCTLLGIEFLVYSVEKEQIYIIGKTYGHNGFYASNTSITAQSIKEIVETNIVNPYYMDKDCQQIIDQSFGVTINPQLIDFEIEFDNTPYIKSELTKLVAQRSPYAQLEALSESSLLYTDTTNNIYDVAAYLRRFGNTFRIRRPKELVDQMKFSINRSLNRYGEHSL